VSPSLKPKLIGKPNDTESRKYRFSTLFYRGYCHSCNLEQKEGLTVTTGSSIMHIMEVKDMALLGGHATYKKYGKDHYVRMGKKSGESRKRAKIGENPQTKII